jgi:hypothetical protein
MTIMLASGQSNSRAVILMASGLILFWMIIGGTLMQLFRDPMRTFVQSIRIDWQIKFVLFATILALIEELITTTMTNLAPLFGVPIGVAYITASNNYFDVVCLHSVVVFIPMFVGLAILLKYFDFSPNAIFLLFGFTGVAAEASFSGWQAIAEFGLWVFIYGLMVYLPTYCIPKDRGAKKPKWWQYVLVVFLPIIFAIPVAVIVGAIYPIRIHFPIIPPNS